MSCGDGFEFRQPFKSLPRVVTSPGIISDTDWDTRSDGDSVGSASSTERKIIVANFLPLNCTKDEAGQWSFSLDDDALLMQLKDGFSNETDVVYVGSLKVQVDPNEQDQVAQKLLKEYRCIPTFLPSDLQKQFYHGFCKQQLWPLFHYMLPICLDKGELFDRNLFQAYVRANKLFADKVMEAINTDDDCVWVHDYHLMLLPTFLRKSRLLGLHYESKRGYIGIDYFGRTVSLKILSVGVHVSRLESVLKLPATISKVQEIEQKYKGMMLMLGVDDMDIFKGISLKLLGLELLLERNPKLRRKVVLVQIINPARSIGKDVQEAIREAVSVAERINMKYGSSGYNPVVLIDHHIPFYEKIAFYAASDCCIVNAVRDGMNLVPYEYTVCRQGNEEIDKLRAVEKNTHHTSTLIVSEFVGCSPSLSGAFRVNPWSVDDVADALCRATDLTESEKRLRHEKHYRYVSTHDVAYWAHSFAQDLDRACKDHYSRRCWAIGFGLNFREVVPFNLSFGLIASKDYHIRKIPSKVRRSVNRKSVLGECPPISLPKPRRQPSNKKQGPAGLAAQKAFGPAGVRRPATTRSRAAVEVIRPETSAAAGARPLREGAEGLVEEASDEVNEGGQEVVAEGETAGGQLTQEEAEYASRIAEERIRKAQEDALREEENVRLMEQEVEEAEKGSRRSRDAAGTGSAKSSAAGGWL
ncbi:hypothetical protein PR202_gb03213 [Eleusine coracana subsp. coracana]|uniref:Alpha,alpha-trehalose-phosphate synthase (UDP-forming) n=1 Tax=Eleusine coracana subsp. coracana TaxID=191504 RepID=A0AAV5E0M7_ELECO|nr:hypothetical protein PR202_gb03213 [Eleusine coracana subsp. coracana]